MAGNQEERIVLHCSPLYLELRTSELLLQEKKKSQCLGPDFKDFGDIITPVEGVSHLQADGRVEM